MADSAGEKKHSASEQRRRKAREDGQVVKSQDLTSAAMLMAAVLALYWFGRETVDKLAANLVQTLSGGPALAVTPHEATSNLTAIALRLGWIVMPLLLVMFVAGIVINITQVGLLLSTKKLMPQFSHINPFAGLKRMFSLQGVMRLGFGIFKILVIACIAVFSIMRQQDAILGIAAMDMPMVAKTLFDCLFDTSLWIAAALLLLALLEYAYQWWKHEEDLKMTDQEVRDEMKESEGDPQMKARRRQIQRQLAMQQVASEVPGADVVVTNPTELAIAIKYDPAEMAAPQVVAKGAGTVAQKIRRLALEHGVPIVERKPLAQVLYKTVDVGGSIPLEQYQAVAEVLRYVYQLQGKSIPQATAA
ncbi:flagellar biosynthesis protein FlhB [Roseimaritima sediminicola]|uniref:flagellar biosynthesis protein FlhB n=1 Tax=Roseimaritima sediminicola TaxID=2662066 RepID=UPI001298374A|nr:flagellar biosynthesis protein FlhB [Roseimaritima sediminicola]